MSFLISLEIPLPKFTLILPIENSEFIFIPYLLFDLIWMGVITPPNGLAPSGMPSPLKDDVSELYAATDPLMIDEWIFTNSGDM